MTDKQIIIDGVDVSGCRAFNNPNYPNKCGITGQDCLGKKCPEMLNQVLEILKTKEQECEELKRQRQADKGLITSTGKMNYQLLQEYDKLKTALTEIKEIAEHCINQDICTFCDNSEKCYIEDEEIPTYDVCKLVLQKISECEGNDESSK